MSIFATPAHALATLRHAVKSSVISSRPPFVFHRLVGSPLQGKGGADRALGVRAPFYSSSFSRTQTSQQESASLAPGYESEHGT